MPAYTFFYDGPVRESERLQLDEEQSHHLWHVMRVRAGECVQLLNGRGELFLVQVDRFAKACELTVKSSIKRGSQPAVRLEILQGLPSLGKAEWIVEKLTELGVEEITFFRAERSGRHELSSATLAKLHRKMISALKQSGQLYLPRLKWLSSLSELENHLRQRLSEQEAWRLITLDPTSPERLGSSFFSQLLKSGSLKAPSLVAVLGPEGGLSERELKLLDELGTHRLSLHENVLRVETANIACAVLLHHLRLEIL